MVKLTPDYYEDRDIVNNINDKLQLISIDDYYIDENLEFNPNLSLEENIARKFILKKKGNDLKSKKQYELTIEHYISLMDNSYFVNDYYPYKQLVSIYKSTKQLDKMTETIASFFESGIYAHPREINWFKYKLIFLEKKDYIIKKEIDSLLDYYNNHGALNKYKEHDPVFIADRIYQRKNGEIQLYNQHYYEKQEERYCLKEKGKYLEHYELYDQARDFYNEIIDADSYGSIEAYKRLAYIYEILGYYENELDIITRFYENKYKIAGKNTKEEFNKRIANLNNLTGNSYSVNDFIPASDNELIPHINNPPFDAYEGDDPYAFVSYSHTDCEIVYKDMEIFYKQELHIWYDEGIPTGNSWKKEVRKKLEESSLFIVFLSQNAIDSSWVNKEIEAAHTHNIPFVPIYIEEFKFPEDTEEWLKDKQAILRYGMNEKNYYKKCTKEFNKKLKEHGIKLKDIETLEYMKLSQLEPPFQPYEGDENYICVNYSYKDTEEIYREIKRFDDEGYYVWYSDDINTGKEWEDDIINHLNRASLFIVFMTSNSIKLRGIKDRIIHALMQNIPVLLIYLDNPEINNSMDRKFRDYTLPHIPCINKTELSDEEYANEYTDAFNEQGLISK